MGAGILVAGTSSDAGKSLVVTGLARALARRGISVAPFKSQNMSNNSMVCVDGTEIGRAQYLQAQAAGVQASSLHNPVLLKPGSDRRAHIVLRGHPAGVLDAGEYATGRGALAEAAYAAYAELADQHELVICEGAGSPAEINLRAGDYVNLGLARRFDMPVVVVGDIDRGGVLASLFGTWALLDDDDRACLKAFVINKFRGDQRVLEPGLAEITARTGVPFLGVLPWLDGVWLDGEATLQLGRWRGSSAPGPDSGAAQHADDEAQESILRVAVVRFPRTSNATDVDALAAEPGVEVQVTTDPGICSAADLLILPGSRATVSDLDWLHTRGLADVVLERAATGRPVLGICGGYQMLTGSIQDQVESGRSVAGLGLLEGVVQFRPEKILARPSGTWQSLPVSGYETHHGVVARPTHGDDDDFPGGSRRRAIYGSIWHGTLECDDFRRLFLQEVAAAARVPWRPAAGALPFAARRERAIDTLADAVSEHLDLDALCALAGVGACRS